MNRKRLDELDAHFRAGLGKGPTLPSRWYFNLTEHCNLACRHCITRAPLKTGQQSARHMSRAVIDAIRPYLAEALYIGMPHAGEPLVAPQLDYLLSSLVEARQGKPTTVHLLTNGKALNEQRFCQLVEQGVNSWSVSVDGMRPETHDHLRSGSSIEALLALIRTCVTLRDARAREVTMGIAWTITIDNAAEIDELLAFAADVGLDWVKLEELFPVNAAGHRLAHQSADELLRVVECARQRARILGVRLLEHVIEMPVFKCRMDDQPAMARFSLLDDLVNRMEINACRLPYELACVEPNGDLKPVSWYHPVAGNVLAQPVSQIWNNHHLVGIRKAAAAKRLCRDSEPTCEADRGPRTREAWLDPVDERD